MTDTPFDRNQVIADNLAGQRNQALDALVMTRADLAEAQDALATANAKVTALEAQVASLTPKEPA